MGDGDGYCNAQRGRDGLRLFAASPRNRVETSVIGGPAYPSMQKDRRALLQKLGVTDAALRAKLVYSGNHSSMAAPYTAGRASAEPGRGDAWPRQQDDCGAVCGGCCASGVARPPAGGALSKRRCDRKRAKRTLGDRPASALRLGFYQPHMLSRGTMTLACLRRYTSMRLPQSIQTQTGAPPFVYYKGVETLTVYSILTL
jgi:hypothetical protein